MGIPSVYIRKSKLNRMLFTVLYNVGRACVLSTKWLSLSRKVKLIKKKKQVNLLKLGEKSIMGYFIFVNKCYIRSQIQG